MRDGRVNWLCTLVAVLVMLFLVAPLIVIVLASFTPTALVTFPPQGFSLKWYANIFASSTHFMEAWSRACRSASWPRSWTCCWA